MEEFKCLGRALTDQNSLQEEINSSLKSRNARYHLVQSCLSSSFISKNKNIMRYRNTILSVLFMGVKLGRSHCGLRVFENRVLRRVFGLRGMREQQNGEKLQNDNINDLFSSPNIIWMIRSRRRRWAGHVTRVGE